LSCCSRSFLLQFLFPFPTRRSSDLTIVYGYFAISIITPVIQFIFPSAGVYNALSAGIAVGIMIIPMICSLSEDAMSAVPRSLRRSEEHTSELQSRENLVCRLLLEKK